MRMHSPSDSFCTYAWLRPVLQEIFFCLSTQVPRHSAGGVGSSYMRTYVHGTYRLQCPCTSNGSRELCHSYLYNYRSANYL